MTNTDIANCRLINQQIAESKFTYPQEVVTWMGAMQAQEYAMAKWAIGLRLPLSKDADIEKAFNNGTILRTHLLRPTWHFVSPADIRWMLQLTAPRVHAVNAFMYRKLELDQAFFKRSTNILIKALQGSKQLTRMVLNSVLEKENIFADGLRLGYILMYAELEGIICSGAKQGNQFTYALLEERVPECKSLNRKEALTELTLRYFTSRGPATVQDFAYWSGLTIKDAKEGIEMVRSNFIKEAINGQDHFFVPTLTTIRKNAQTTFLMPDYDEYGISYKNRSALFNSNNIRIENGNTSYNRMLILEGCIVGSWKRTINKARVIVEINPTIKLSKAAYQDIVLATDRFAAFLGMPAEIIISPD
ncbi:MAG: winged helix DNA-binding domain-containing protein [Daejeonella sp.]